MRAALALIVLLAVGGRQLETISQEVLDRTLALVGGQPITLSDTRGAIALGLIAAGTSQADAVTQLIRRELILREVQRYAPAAPSASAVATRLAEIRKRFADGAELARVLDAHAFSDTRLRAWVSDDLRTETYLAQRFASASTPTDLEVSRHYTENKTSFDRQGLTFEAAAPLIRAQLVELRRGELILDWVADLRRRTEVITLQQ